ncbi:MAG: hypothetical protein ABIF19_12935 [Planctomycetota bacterium]
MMTLGFCDVAGCAGETYMGWRPLTEPRGKQVCEYHWLRHKDPNDDFDLFEAFGFRRPAGIRKSVAKKEVARCACGRERLPGRKLCTDCAQERERQRKKRAYHKRKEPQPEPVEGKRPKCKGCGGPREAGHTYCEKCAERRRITVHRQAQGRYRRKDVE